MEIPADVLERILSSGVAAPSADNCHLFYFVIRGSRILIQVDDAYRRASPQRQLLAWIAYGAVVENMLLAAAALGWIGKAVCFPSDEAVCEISLSPGAESEGDLANAIPWRCTNRRFFTGPPLQLGEQAMLEGELDGIEGVRLLWMDTPDRRRQTLTLMRLAESERFRRKDLHAELFSSLRFDVGYGENCEQGIPLGATEIEFFARPFFRLMRHWGVMRVLNLAAAYWFLGWRAAYFPARSSPHLGLLVAEGELRTAAIRAGRAFERLWLRACRLGLALQPMVAAPLYSLDVFEGVSPAVRKQLQIGWQGLVRGGGTPLLLFRLGRARAPSVRAGRLPVVHYLRFRE